MPCFAVAPQGRAKRHDMIYDCFENDFIAEAIINQTGMEGRVIEGNRLSSLQRKGRAHEGAASIREAAPDDLGKKSFDASIHVNAVQRLSSCPDVSPPDQAWFILAAERFGLPFSF